MSSLCASLRRNGCRKLLRNSDWKTPCGTAGARDMVPDTISALYMHMNPVRKGLVKRPEDWPWSSFNNFALDHATVAACPIQIDYVRLPSGYHAREKPTIRTALTVATRCAVGRLTLAVSVPHFYRIASRSFCRLSFSALDFVVSQAYKG
jgi:hypothetical protein